MQSTLTARETDPHDDFVIEPDVVLAARADHAAPDPINSLLAPPIYPSPDLSAPTPIPPVAPALRVADDIEVPRDIRVSGGRPPRSRWASRAIIGFLFALYSAAAAEGWNHYGDAAEAVIANWSPFVLNPSPPEKAAVAEQAGAPGVQESSQESSQASSPAAAADQAAAQPVPAAKPAQGTASTDTASAATVSAGAPPVTDAASPPSPPPMARDIAAMGQQIEALKASIEQLKAGQEQMAQQIARNSAARTVQARPSEIRPADQSLHARVTAALSPRPAAPPPPRKPRPAYPAAPVYAPPQAAAALPPATAAPPPQSAPLPYEPRAQAADQTDGDPVVRPPMPVR